MQRLVLAITLYVFGRPVGTPAQTVEHPLTVGNGVLPPKLVHQVDPEVTPGKRKSFSSEVTLIVDEQGLPQQVKIAESSDPAFDPAILQAVNQYRFLPATKAGVPVAVKLNISINVDLF